MQDALPPRPVFVLVRPQMGENIGAAARAMLNFGLADLRLVAPRDGWPNSRAGAMASGAGRVLDGAGVFEDLAGALADVSFTLATTARPRELTKPVLTVEAAMVETGARIAAGQRVAVLFGPERAGLENDDIARANAIISVPVDPAFPSLNLAQCVLLTAYEWRRTAVRAQANTQTDMQTDVQAEAPRPGEAAPAVHAEIEALARHYEDRLEEAGFFFPETKVAAMKTNLRNLWSRLPLTSADVRMLHGMLRQLIRQQSR